MTETENFNGSDCSGSDGQINRILTINNIDLTSDSSFLIFVDGLNLVNTSGYTVSHNSNHSTITFLNNVWNSQKIVVQYETTSSPISYTYGLTISDKLLKGISKVMSVDGITNLVKVISYTIPTGSYDDYTIQTITGSQYISGLVFPVRGAQGSEEALLLEQGILSRCLVTWPVSTAGKRVYCATNLNNSPEIIRYYEQLSNILKTLFLWKNFRINLLFVDNFCLSIFNKNFSYFFGNFCCLPFFKTPHFLTF